jgi:dye decolorizing peroxidase
MTTSRGSKLSRRRLLLGGAAVAGGATLAGALTSCAAEDQDAATSSGGGLHGGDVVTATGLHQAGVTTPPQAHTWFVSLDVVDGVDRAALRRLMVLWTDDIARLTSGRAPLADQERELAEVPARLTVTVGVGPELFTKAGLAAARPASLAPLPAFERIDRLEERWSGGDLLLQIGSDDVVTVSHAMRVLVRDARSFASVRWVQRGFGRARGSVPDGTTARNLLGQVDGSANPTGEALEGAVWSAEGWLAGGTMLVLRRIRFDRDHWEQIGRTDRELVIGRRLDDGAPLTGGAEKDAVDLAAVDENGLEVVPAFAHVRQARARDASELMLRRGYSYDDSPADDGSDDAGLLFAAYVADIERQFVPVQRRLAENDLLNRWTIPVGSAVFAILPGVTGTDTLGHQLLDA